MLQHRKRGKQQTKFRNSAAGVNKLRNNTNVDMFTHIQGNMCTMCYAAGITERLYVCVCEISIYARL